LEEAVAALARAAEADPSFTEARRNLAAALLKAGRQEESLRTCDGILAQDPRDAATWFNRGNVLLAQQQFSDALVSFSRALELGTFADCLINRGDALLKMHRPREALADFDRALQHKPDSVLALNNAGNALLALGHSEEALGRYDAALALDPDAVDSHYNRGAALRDLKRFVEAGQAYATVLKGAPAHEQAAGNLFHVNLDCCDWNRYDELIVRLRADLQSRRWVVNPLSGLLLDEPALQLACARGHVARQYPSQCRVRPPADPGAGESRPLRVAYVSADFREHPVAHLLTGVLERHDRARVSVVGVSLAPAQDSRQGHRMRAACDEMIDAWGMADAEVAALLRSRGIDIAVDAMGFTQGMRLGIFAQRAASVQVGYVGYAGTTGADFLDYLIADDTVIPHDMKDAYVEQIVRLPHCYLPYEGVRETAAPPTRAAAGLPEQALVLCGFTNAYKINPAIFDAWMRLLRELPEAILWLRPLPDEARANLQREARSRGVDADRLIFAPHVPDMAEHLARQALADLYLDTSPYNAHSTACDALWSGVPLVTCTGRGFASRVAASVLHAAGLSQFVTRDLGQYQDVVLRFARDRELLRQLRHGLLQRRAKLPLFDIATYTRHLEVAYHGMHERVLREGRPSPFNVASLMPRPE
jgi:protein O-GlcNAc transferase